MRMGFILGLALLASMAVPAAAQDIPEITVRPLDRGIGDNAYVGPYGRQLPGVSMFAGRAVPVSPDFAEGGVPLPSRQRISQEYTYQDPLPVLDGWHGTLSRGFAF